MRELVTKIGNFLASKKLSISTAESCTGGLLGANFTAISGSSAWYKGGVIAYSNEIKEQVLSVLSSTLEKEGAVSAQTVEEMAVGVSRLFDTEYAISISGIAGPTGGTIEKPVGLVYIGIKAENETLTYKCNFSGNRDEVRDSTVKFCIEKLIELI